MLTRSLERTGDEAIRSHLLSGERIFWLGNPDLTKRFSPADRFLVPFSLLWGGFAFFWEATVLVGLAGGNHELIFFALFGLPFMLVGFYLVLGRFMYKRRKKARTTYAVTNRRVMTVVRGSRGDEIDAAFISTIPAINTRAAGDGAGSVTFGSYAPWQSFYANTGMDFFGWSRTGGGAPLSFFDISDAHEVADLVSRLRDEQLQQASSPHRT